MEIKPLLIELQSLYMHSHWTYI